MVISETLARARFPARIRSANGSRAASSRRRQAPDFKVVVGVAGDVRSTRPGEAPRPEFYLPLPQAPDEAWNWMQRMMYIVVRTDGDPAALTEPLRAIVRRIAPGCRSSTCGRWTSVWRGRCATARFNTLLLSLLGGIGLLLAAIGIYGVIAYFVSQRTQEIGVRIALGATQRGRRAAGCRSGGGPVAIGLVLGVLGVAGADRCAAARSCSASPHAIRWTLRARRCCWLSSA